ncbi:hypothetical protein ACFE04_017349 [Oxalis oulophora]
MDRLRPRSRPRLEFSGFTKSERLLCSVLLLSSVFYGVCKEKEKKTHCFVLTIVSFLQIEKMEKQLKESEGEPLNKEIFQKFARSFSYSAGRAGKPAVKWTDVKIWFLSHQQDVSLSAKVGSSTSVSKACCPNKSHQCSAVPGGPDIPDLSELEFEARSSNDGAWYDVDVFRAHRFLSSGETEVRVRYVGFGAEEDEWVNLNRQVRVRSIPLEHSECHKVKIGDLVLCFQEQGELARYYDACVVDIQRKLHDIRGCRCIFLIRYNHDNTEERVRLRRLCRRPNQY